MCRIVVYTGGPVTFFIRFGTFSLFSSFSQQLHLRSRIYVLRVTICRSLLRSGPKREKFAHSSIRSNTATPSLPIVVYIILYMYRSELFLYLKTTHNATTLFSRCVNHRDAQNRAMPIARRIFFLLFYQLINKC